jgi:serine/threonine protein phosphatase 1
MSNKYYVFSDLHGQGKLWEQIKNFKAKDPSIGLVYLGDACDRGPDGYKIMKEMLADDDILYIKGNHEDMFVKAAKALYKQGARVGEARDIIYDAYYDEDVNLHLNNGGFSTLMTWVEDGMPMGIINELETLPTLCKVTNNEGVKLTFSHAGFREEDINNKEEHVWSRDHFSRKWKDGIMIHGHTPVMSSHMRFFTEQSREEAYTNPMPQWYADDTKLDIDTGCFSTNVIYLVNTDTMEMIKFCQE